MITPDLTSAVWHKSSRSDNNGGQCVEVASNLPGLVAVRDSKDVAGPVLSFERHAWSAFLDSVPGRPVALTIT
jgi:hypothetical protein